MNIVIEDLTPEQLAILAEFMKEKKVFRRKVKRQWIVLGCDMKPLYTGLCMSDAKELSKHIAGGCITTETIHSKPRTEKGRKV